MPRVKCFPAGFLTFDLGSCESLPALPRKTIRRRTNEGTSFEDTLGPHGSLQDHRNARFRAPDGEAPASGTLQTEADY